MKSVVTNEYKELQETVLERQQELKLWLKGKTSVHLSSPLIDRKIPIVKQISLAWAPTELYIESARSLTSVLKRKRPDLEQQLNTLINQLDVDTALTFMEESLTFSQRYFRQWAAENNVPAWLPEFIAEQSLRPFLYLLADGSARLLDSFDVKGLCPCCAEPLRLAELGDDGEKKLFCPRCEASWQPTKTGAACAHCGEDRQDRIAFLETESDENVKLEVCKTCNGYLKMILVDKLAITSPPALYDLETLHLDYTAQDAGYGEKLEF